jgi:hypothetical protein
MSFFKSMFESNSGEEKAQMVSHKVFEGDWQKAEDFDPLVTKSIENLMNFALTIRRKEGAQAFAEPGEAIKFEMEGVVLGKRGDESSETPAGNFEVVIRRVS